MPDFYSSRANFFALRSTLGEGLIEEARSILATCRGLRPQSDEGILFGNGQSKLGGKAPSEEMAYSYAWEELIGRMQRWIEIENGAPELWRIDGAPLC